MEKTINEGNEVYCAYDGKEARVGSGVDSWGYPTGGEERDYGDFISSVKEANLSVHEELQR